MILALLLIAMLSALPAEAQVTIGANRQPAATLDVVASAPNTTSVAEGVIVPRLTKEQINAKQAAYTTAQTGAQVYITDYSAPSISGYSDQIGCVGFAYWNGAQWIMDCGLVRTYAEVATQPKPFTFYEQGTESEVPLTVGANGSSALTYEWRKITDSNLHVHISVPCTADDGDGFNTPSFTPHVAGSLDATNTLMASKNGFYRYFVRITNQTGETVDSEVAEVAVGCGAKDLNGVWISFMCNNLGANMNNTMAVQEATSITLIPNDAVETGFLRSKNERELYGDLYQWGRIADGHENRNAISENGSGGDDDKDNCITWNATTPPIYENGNVLGPAQAYPFQQVARTSDYFGKFIKTAGTNDLNWYSGPATTQNDANLLWRDGTFAANDPCQKVSATGEVPSGNVPEWYPPASSSLEGGSSGTGWRIPSQDEWAMLYRGGTTAGSSSNALANSWVWYELSASPTEGAKGFELRPDGVTTTLFLPVGGSRVFANALLLYNGLNGSYWSSSSSGIEAFELLIAPGGVSPSTVAARGYGMSLRCIKSQ